MDYVAAALELACIYLVGNKCKWGFVVGLACNFTWIAVSLSPGLYGLVLVSIAAAVLNIRNFIKWSRA